MKKRGFAIIELLVLIGTISLLLTLMLPAIQEARQDARKRACINNLKQLGLAMHNYHDVYQVFPPGWISRESAPECGPRIGWQTSILPFIDQAPLYNMVNFNSPPIQADGSPVKLFQTPIATFRCPQDTLPPQNSLRGDYGTSNYSGNYGDVPGRLAPLGLADVWAGFIETPMRSRGIFACNSSESMRDITDGTSNTMMVGERGITSGAGIWVGVTRNSHSDDAVTDASHLSRPNASWSSYSSGHGGGVHILMCDGSARFLSENIDSKPGPDLGTFQKLACKNDGQPIGDF